MSAASVDTAPALGRADGETLSARAGRSVLTALPQLVCSVEPAIVFASLATVAVPRYADACRVRLREQDGQTHRIQRPTPQGCPGVDSADLVDGLVVSLDEPPSDDGAHIGYQVRLAFTWQDPTRPTDSDAVIAQLLADRAVDLIRHERLAVQARASAERAANLEIALQTNREIAQALGILMATYKLTHQHAFDLLRDVSQHTHRKLRDVAAEVSQTGTLDIQAALRHAPAPPARPHSGL